MRQLLAAIVSWGVLLAAPSRADEEFPYKALVTADDVYVRSGPGQSYYPTDKLKAGQEVEVYRHDPGGWYAIKPPEGSFTWVSSRFLRPGTDNLAVVTDDRVAARVGSRFSNIRDVIQAWLNKAEVVEVLEKVETGSGGDRKTWYKIAPPSGEFRWVFGKYVDPDYLEDGLREARAAENRADLADTPAVQAAEPATSTTRPRSPVEESAVVTARPPADGTERLILEPEFPRRISAEQYREELEKTDLELSIMVVEEPTVWQFEELWRRGEELLALAETALERGQARALLNKIRRFEDIKRRHDTVSLVRRDVDRSNYRLATMKRSDPQLARRRTLEDRFDGVGELTRVVSPKLGAPRYALVDEVGGVRCYVTPAPGVNMRHYIGRRVGVSGTRGYMPEQHAHHLMARHVSLLEGQGLR